MRIALIIVLALAAFAQNEHVLTIIPKADDSVVGELRFREKLANGTNYVGFKAPASLSGSVLWQLPSVDGASGKCLGYTSAATLGWVDCSAGSGVSLPVEDSKSIVYGSADPTKELRFEVDGFTTGAKRVVTFPDSDITVMSTDTTQTVTGVKTINAYLYFTNNKKITMADSGGTQREMLWFDSSNDFHVGAQSAPSSGNGALTLYAYGESILKMKAGPLGSARASFAPITNGYPTLGATSGCGSGATGPCHWGLTFLGPTSIYTDTPADPAFLSLYSGTYGEDKYVRLYGPSSMSSSSSYSLYLPSAQATAAGQVLTNNGSGVLSWATAASLPAGTTDYTLRYDGSAWVASSDLTNGASGVTVDGPAFAQHRYSVAGNIAMFHSRGSKGSPESTQSGDEMGIVSSRGYGASGYSLAGNTRIVGVAAENFSGGTYGSDLFFSTTPIGGTTNLERMRIMNNGNVLVGTTDNDGTPATGRLVAKGSTNDGSTNIIVGRDSDEANVFAVDTDGNLTATGLATVGSFKMATGAGAGKLLTSDASGNGTWQAPATPSGMMTTNTDQNVTGVKTVQTALGVDYLRVHKLSDRAVIWQHELSSDGNNYFLKDPGPNVVLQFATTPVRNGFVRGNWLPMVGATYSLGASGYAWTKLWTADVSATGNVSVGSFTMSSGAASGKVFTSDSSGNATWQNASTPSGMMTTDTNQNVTGTKTVQTAFGVDYLRIHKVSDRATIWQHELTSDGTTYRLKDPGPNIVLQIQTTPARIATWMASLIPNGTNTYDLGTSSYYWKQSYTNTVTVGQYLNGTFSMSGNMTVTGNFYGRTFSGAPSCSGVSDGWTGVDTTNKRSYVCIGGSAYYSQLTN